MSWTYGCIFEDFILGRMVELSIEGGGGWVDFGGFFL